MDKPIIINGEQTHYTVSEAGIVKRVSYTNNYGRVMKAKVMKTYIAKSGHVFVNIRHSSSNNTLTMLQRLVAEAFVPNPENKRTVTQKNGNKLDCRSSNLKWVSKSETGKENFKSGKQVYSEKKLTPSEVAAICSLRDAGTKELSEMFGVSKCHIGNIINGKRWNHL